MRLGILQRYVLGDVLRSFLLALVAITAIFVLFMVMAQAVNKGLTPQDLLRIIPFLIPMSLIYTVPVALLFAVTVVYGRLASDNEVVAIKTAGLSAWTVLAPTFVLGLALAGVLLVASNDLIPRANMHVKTIIFSNLQDMFYKVLKANREWPNPEWPFFISVRDVEGKTLVGAVFKHRAGGPDNPNVFDAVIQAERATIHFEPDPATGGTMARVKLIDSIIQLSGEDPDVILIDDDTLIIPFSDRGKSGPEARMQEMTRAQMIAKQAELREKLRNERARQAVSAALWVASGRVGRVDWPHIRGAYYDQRRWEREFDELETEKHMRIALACGSFFFALLGSPVGILFARRDFLSAFISCFLPIIIVYYPLTLMGVNLGKEGQLNPVYAMWVGNFVLGLLAGAVALPPVLKH